MPPDQGLVTRGRYTQLTQGIPSPMLERLVLLIGWGEGLCYRAPQNHKPLLSKPGDMADPRDTEKQTQNEETDNYVPNERIRQNL